LIISLLRSQHTCLVFGITKASECPLEKYYSKVPSLFDSKPSTPAEWQSLSDLLSWHHNDEVNTSEITRNNLTCSLYQHNCNRNPFVDFPWLSEAFEIVPLINSLICPCDTNYTYNSDSCGSVIKLICYALSTTSWIIMPAAVSSSTSMLPSQYHITSNAYINITNHKSNIYAGIHEGNKSSLLWSIHSVTHWNGRNVISIITIALQYTRMQ
jgi:hypothetical protein